MLGREFESLYCVDESITHKTDGNKNLWEKLEVGCKTLLSQMSALHTEKMYYFLIDMNTLNELVRNHVHNTRCPEKKLTVAN